MFKLVIQDDEGKTTVVPLIRDEITIGRKEGNTIRLTERNVSRRHARIVRANGDVQIEDLGSYNGIRVNNARIAERVSLRVSDQVQIGDYKLYLKTDTVEQVDDARTMPIERVDSGTATDVIPAIAPPAQTAPPVSAIASTPGAPRLVGDPARTLVAIADTDPAGRPVASAATVAALSASAGYGKLVVLSSNFAGKEFELSRPQMIIGRTDENDIWINHRSISRNHAKLVREPETGRYTISDLQSSNGVRVNGQDYGKVELRRGDVVDLGHVRLRFVEPGEDFVFARDAKITDVPETGKKGVMVAVVLGVIVLGAVVAFFALRGGNKDNGKGSNGMVDKIVDAGAGGSQVAINGSNGSDGSDTVGSDGSGTVPTITPDAPEAGSAAVNPPQTGNAEVEQRCTELQKDKKWADLQLCSNELRKTNPARADALGIRAKDEINNEKNKDKLADAVKDENLDAAYAAINHIAQTSVYYPDARAQYGKLEGKILSEQQKKARAASAAKDCRQFDVIVKQTPAPIQAQVKKIGCEEKSAGSGVVVTPPSSNCDPAKMAQWDTDGRAAFSSSSDSLVQQNFDKLLACKYNDQIAAMTIISACRSGLASKAKQMFAKLPQVRQQSVETRCAVFKVPVR